MDDVFQTFAQTQTGDAQYQEQGATLKDLPHQASVPILLGYFQSVGTALGLFARHETQHFGFQAFSKMVGRGKGVVVLFHGEANGPSVFGGACVVVVAGQGNFVEVLTGGAVFAGDGVDSETTVREFHFRA